MDVKLRGVIEEAIDQYITADFLGSAIAAFEEFTPILSSKEDVLFGYVYRENHR